MKPRYLRKASIRRRRVLSLSLFALIVAGCAQTVADWSPAEAPTDIEVQWVTLAHTVSFPADDDAMTRREIRRLDAFLSQVGLRQSDRLYIDTGRQRDVDFEDPRVTMVRERVHLHLPGVQLAAIESLGAPGRNLTVVVGRYVAIAPDCPNWSRPSQSNPGNHVDGNFGCATQTNLSRMVADPGDLFRGRDLTPADGMALSAGIRRYRSGETIAPVLPKDSEQ